MYSGTWTGVPLDKEGQVRSDRVAPGTERRVGLSKCGREQDRSEGTGLLGWRWTPSSPEQGVRVGVLERVGMVEHACEEDEGSGGSRGERARCGRTMRAVGTAQLGRIVPRAFHAGSSGSH